MTELQQMKLAPYGPDISRLGMGCWAMGGHGWGEVNESDSIRAVRSAYENGVTFFDTADAYGLGYSERLLAEALGPNRKEVVIATKGGVRWNSQHKVWTDISPEYLRFAVESSLRRLRLDQIPLYYIHKPDGRTPIVESVSALEQLRQEGKIGSIGISNVSVAQLIEAVEVAPISALQARLNLLDQGELDNFSKLCKEHGITFVAWGALADGLLTGKFTPESTFPEDDHRIRMPDFKGDRFRTNLDCVKRLKHWADSRDLSLAQMALRWVLDSADFICALFGAKTELQVKSNLEADSIRLSMEEIGVLNELVEEFRR